MTSLPISAKLKIPVWAAFRRHCHRFLAAGYNEALDRIRTDPDEETDITGYICEGLENWFRAHPEESYCFFVKDDPPLPGTGKTGKRRSRTDIIIGYAAGTRPEFYFEAKRLHRTKAVGTRYTGAEGMGCFLSGRYASDCLEAAMVGYVQTDTLAAWQIQLQKRVQEEAQDLRLENTELDLNFESAFPLEWASTHGRDGGPSVKLFHVLLDCRKAEH